GIGAADSAAAWKAPVIAVARTNSDTAGFMHRSASSRWSRPSARRKRRAQSSYARKCTSPLLPLIHGLIAFIGTTRRILQ
ncbi:TPA: hypothetical protein ACT5CH_003755, partial [Burkholderia cenocepacia]